MQHKVGVWKSEHDQPGGDSRSDRHVTLVTVGNRTYNSGRRSVTLRSEPTQPAPSVPQIVAEQVVEASPRSPEPFDANVGGSPLLLEVGLQQLRHRVDEIQRTTIPEVQAGPTVGHAGIVA